MGQVFSSDAQVDLSSPALPHGVLTPVVQTKPLAVPFETAKGVISGAVVVFSGVGTTRVRVVIVRNPTTDNVTVAEFDDETLIDGKAAVIPFLCVDQIPSPRDVVYQVQVDPITVDASADICSVQATLISG